MSTGHDEAVDQGELEQRMRRIAEHEAATSLTPIGRALRVAGRTRAFASIYRRVGPRLDTWLSRRFKGQVTAKLYGLPSLVLVTIGGKTGLARPSPLLYVRDGADFVVVGTNFGQGHHPAWTNNLAKNPSATVELGPVVVPVVAKVMVDADFARCWSKFVDMYPGYAGYLERSGRTPRMFRLVATPTR